MFNVTARTVDCIHGNFSLMRSASIAQSEIDDKYYDDAEFQIWHFQDQKEAEDFRDKVNLVGVWPRDIEELNKKVNEINKAQAVLLNCKAVSNVYEAFNEGLMAKNEQYETEIENLKSKLEQATSDNKYYYEHTAKLTKEINQIHNVLDHLPNNPPRGELETENNKWPEQYNIVTRFSIWLGNK